MGRDSRLAKCHVHSASASKSYCRWRKKYGGLRTDQAQRLYVLEQENTRLTRLVADLSLYKAKLRETVSESRLARQDDVRRYSTWGQTFFVSERRAWRALGQPRYSQRHTPQLSEAQERPTESIVKLASKHGRYGYRRITTLLQWEGWRVNHKRAGCVWRQGGLDVHQR